MCLWMVPFMFILSLSANDNTLPTTNVGKLETFSKFKYLFIAINIKLDYLALVECMIYCNFTRIVCTQSTSVSFFTSNVPYVKSIVPIKNFSITILGIKCLLC